jgi:hypothetical protein
MSSSVGNSFQTSILTIRDTNRDSCPDLDKAYIGPRHKVILRDILLFKGKNGRI